MLPLMRARDYLTQLTAAAAQSLAELPHGPCDPEIAIRILRRLEPLVGDAAAACCDFDATD
jgi:hypothetical protein